MTTIAYDGKCIAVDSRETLRSLICDDAKLKIIHTDDGAFVYAGTVADAPAFIEDFEDGQDVGREYDVEGFHVSVKGVARLLVCDAKFLREPCNTPWAIGSGMCWALAAMDHGKNAADAVRYAATRDTHTGGAIRVLDPKTLKVKTYKK